MKKSILSLEGVEVISKEQKKSLFGGKTIGGEAGACAYAQAQYCPDSAKPCIDTTGPTAVCNSCCLN
jgi:hypothetical protein